MSIHQRSENGTWFVSYRDAAGKRKTKNFGSGRDAKRAAAKFDAEAKAKRTLAEPIVEEVPGQVVYLDQLAQLFIDTKKAEGKGKERLTQLKALLEKHFIPVFAQRPISTIRLDELLGIVAKAYKKTGPITRGRYLAYIKTLFQFAVNMDLLEKNPLARWKKPKEIPRDSKLTIEDLQRLIQIAPPHLSWALEIAWNLGVRTGKSELLALKWCDVDWEGCAVKVFGKKTKTHRVIPVSPEFLARLKQKRKEARSDHLVEWRGKRLNKFHKSFPEARKALKLPYHFVMYEVRHLFATTLLRAHNDLGAVSQMLGHHSIKMTADVYYHVQEEDKRRAAATLPQMTPK